ncbi:hypothetical protein LUZ60_000866 [Juncus effusus]|nr:hypothetical protein LUZ60_000866 [Juncus effusus]
MAISLSSFSPHCLPSPQSRPNSSRFLCFSSNSSSHAIQSRNSNVSLKPSFSRSASHDRKPSSEAIRLSNQLRKSLQEKNYTESVSVVESMASRGYNLHIKSCAELIKCLFKSGKQTEAARVISVFESHRQAKTVLYNAFITGLCRKSQIIPALETVGRMRANRCEPNIVTCNILVGGLCDRGMLDFAFETVEHFKTNYEVRPNLITYNPLLEGTFLVKGAKEGMGMLDEMESHGIIPDHVTYNLVMRAMCKTGHVDEMLPLLDDISLSGVKLDFTSYRALLEALLEKKRFGEVDKVIDEMLVRACWMSHGQLDSVVTKLCKNGLVDKARVLLEGIVKGQWMRLGYKCCNMVIGNFIKEGRLERAVDFIDYLITVGRVPNISFYNPILSGLCKCGQVCHILEMLDKLEKIGCSPNEVTYTILIGALWNIGDHFGSVKMMSRLLEKGLRPDGVTYGTLITCLCKDGMVDEAMQLKSILVERGLRVSVRIYDVLLLGFCKVGRVNEAIDLLDEMFEKYGEVYKKSIVVILEGLVHIGYESETRKIAQELVLRNVISPDSVDLLDEEICRMSIE